MNDLRRELAPVTAEAWAEIEREAEETLRASLAARKLVDFRGPLGWKHSAVDVGRVRPLDPAPCGGVEARLRQLQPLVELRVPFSLAREELDSVSRGAADAELSPLISAARTAALAEDRLVFAGYEAAGVRGLADSAHAPIPIGEDFQAFPRVLLEGLEVLREAGVGGPYALALGPRHYNGLAKTTSSGGYPVIQHVRRLIDGPIVWAPGVDGALVLSQRGGDFELTTGRDLSIGYLDHDASSVRLYLEESLTFRNLTPEAAVRLSP